MRTFLIALVNLVTFAITVHAEVRRQQAYVILGTEIAFVSGYDGSLDPGNLSSWLERNVWVDWNPVSYTSRAPTQETLTFEGDVTIVVAGKAFAKKNAIFTRLAEDESLQLLTPQGDCQRAIAKQRFFWKMDDYTATEKWRSIGFNSMNPRLAVIPNAHMAFFHHYPVSFRIYHNQKLVFRGVSLVERFEHDCKSALLPPQKLVERTIDNISLFTTKESREELSKENGVVLEGEIMITSELGFSKHEIVRIVSKRTNEEDIVFSIAPEDRASIASAIYNSRGTDITENGYWSNSYAPKEEH